jgi:hypothetical protein
MGGVIEGEALQLTLNYHCTPVDSLRITHGGGIDWNRARIGRWVWFLTLKACQQ